ncbi:MAG TPA: response regulator transcription factor [Herpetosiphonaceae bacterium]
MASVVIIEDERDLNNILRSHLEHDGHTVYQAFDGPGGLELVESARPQLVILDWMLPGRDGLAVCREIRQRHLMPIMMLTARGEEIDRVLGLEVGADDYLVKPFSVRELLARVRSLLRRVALDTLAAIPAADRSSTPVQPTSVPAAPQPVMYGSLRIDLAERQATVDGRSIDLTRREWDMLVLLATHPGRAFSRDFLLEHLWGYAYDGGDRTVDSHVAQLRRKLGATGQRIVTVWGVGYRWKNDDGA